MPGDPVPRIAILSTHLYRAEALAFALAQHLNLETVMVVQPSTELPSDFGVILIDLDMGEEPALLLTQKITSCPSQARVILLGLVETEESVLRLAEMGGGGYVSTNATFTDLVSVVRSVDRGEFACRPDITYALFSRLSELAYVEKKTVDASVLTMRERQIFTLLSQRLMNRQIAAQLYLSEHTVKNHVHHILKKLGIRNRNFAFRPDSHLAVPESSHETCAFQ